MPAGTTLRDEIKDDPLQVWDDLEAVTLTVLVRDGGSDFDVPGLLARRMPKTVRQFDAFGCVFTVSDLNWCLPSVQLESVPDYVRQALGVAPKLGDVVAADAGDVPPAVVMSAAHNSLRTWFRLECRGGVVPYNLRYSVLVDLMRPAAARDAYRGTVTQPPTLKQAAIRVQVVDPGPDVVTEWNQQVVKATHTVLFDGSVPVVKGDVLVFPTGEVYGVGSTQSPGHLGEFVPFTLAHCIETVL